MNDNATAAEALPDDFADIEPPMRGVCAKYGRDMFALVMNAGLSSEATKVLAEQAAKHRSRAAMHAVGVLSSSFNQIATEYCKMKGWDEGTLAQCDRDIGLAWKGKLVEAPSVLTLDS